MTETTHCPRDLHCDLIPGHFPHCAMWSEASHALVETPRRLAARLADEAQWRLDLTLEQINTLAEAFEGALTGVLNVQVPT